VQKAAHSRHVDAYSSFTAGLLLCRDLAQVYADARPFGGKLRLLLRRHASQLAQHGEQSSSSMCERNMVSCQQFRLSRQRPSGGSKRSF
jgi:hypothetical protein